MARSANSLISRRVTLGDRSASPLATTRTARTSSAGSVCLTRKPLAPARSASNTYSSSSKVVRMTTRTPVSRPSPAISCVACSPSRPGIRMSISTTSGVSSRTSRTAAAPSAAWPTTSMPSWASSRAANPARTRAWSSASSTRIIAAPAALFPAAGGPGPRTPHPARARRSAARPGPRRARSCRESRGPRHWRHRATGQEP